MASFMFIFRGGVDAKDVSLSPEEMQQHMQKWMTWFEHLSKSGAFKGQGAPLQPGGKAVVGQRKVVTDGPYGEAKDVVGGYAIIEAGDLDAAIEIARGCPTYEKGGVVEVRLVASAG